MRNVIQIVCVAVIVAALGSVVSAKPIYVEMFGNPGWGDVDFSSIQAIAMDAEDNLYVSESYRVRKFSLSDGSISHEWSFVGDIGYDDGELISVEAIAVNSAGGVYMLDQRGARLQKFSDLGGTATHEWTRDDLSGSDVVVDSSDNIYLLGSIIRKYGEYAGNLTLEWTFGGYGTGNGQFDHPRSLAIDSDGNMYVSDAGNDRIQKLSQSGGTVSFEWKRGSEGSGNNQFDYPTGIAVNPGGSIYVADYNNDRIQKFTQSDTYNYPVYEWSIDSRGSSPGQINDPLDVAVDSVGNLYVSHAWDDHMQRWFDWEELPAGQTAPFGDLTLWSDENLGDSVVLDSGRTLKVFGTTTIEPGRSLTLLGTTLNTADLVIHDGGALNIQGVVNGAVRCPAGGQLNFTGNAVLGDPDRYDGFDYEGTLVMGAHNVTLHSKGLINLWGIVTELDGNTFTAPNGIALGVGRNLVGWGSVDAKVSAGFGSTIEATGPLSLGDAGAYDGFFSDGSLITGAHTLTIYDRNVAVLGSLTELGDGVSGGTLTAGNADPADTHAHFLLEQGKNMVGRGSVNGHYMNHGDVIGDGTAAAERLILTAPWSVSGKGSFTNTLILGTFSPGESPGITTGENQGFGGTVQVELGGTEAGSGAGNHDQINDFATILLFNSPALDIFPWNNFIPEVGDEFVILTWEESLDGEFGDVTVDPWFTDFGLDFDLHYNSINGPGNLTIEATPEPATLAVMTLCGLAVVRRRRRK